MQYIFIVEVRGQGSGVRSQELGVRSWSSELELESGGVGVSSQESGVGGQEFELEFRVGVGEWWVRG